MPTDLSGNGDIPTYDELTASLPLVLDDQCTVTAAAIDLSVRMPTLPNQVTGILSCGNGGTGTAATLAGNRIMISSAAQSILEGSALTNGQLFIGSTGAAPVAATVTAGSTSLVVTPGAGTLSINTAQGITTSDSPAFANVTDTGLTASTWVCADAAKKLVSQTLSGTLNQITCTGAAGSGATTLSLPQDIATTSSPTFATEILTTVNPYLNIHSNTPDNGPFGPLFPDATLSLRGSTSVTACTVKQSRGGILMFDDKGYGTQFRQNGSQPLEISAAGLVGVTDLVVGTSFQLAYATASMPVLTDASSYLTSGAIALASMVSGVLPVANGGSNSSTALTNGKLMVSAAGKIVEGTSAADPSFNSLALTGTTQSTSSTTGGLVTASGVGIAKDLFIAGDITIGEHKAPKLNLISNVANGNVNINMNNGTSSSSIFTLASLQNLVFNNGGSGATAFVGNSGVDTWLTMTTTTNTFLNPLSVPSLNVSGLTASSVVLTDGSKNLVSGTVSLTSQVSGSLPLANGGTNQALTASNGGIAWSDASKLNILAGTATSGQFLLSGATATPSWSNTVPNISTFSNATDSTTVSTGAIVTSGGIGAAKNITSLTQTTTGTTNASSLTTGTLITAGGIGCAKTIYCTDFNCANRIVQKEYYLYLRTTGAQSIANGTYSGVTFTAAAASSNWNPAFGTLYLFTPPVNGRYTASGCVAFAGSAGGDLRYMSLVVNYVQATGAGTRWYTQGNGGGANGTYLTGGGPIRLLTTDTISMVVWQNSGGALNIAGSAGSNDSVLSIEYLGA